MGRSNSSYTPLPEEELYQITVVSKPRHLDRGQRLAQSNYMAAHSTSGDHASAQCYWANPRIMATLSTQTASLAQTQMEFFVEAFDLVKRPGSLVSSDDVTPLDHTNKARCDHCRPAINRSATSYKQTPFSHLWLCKAPMFHL